jgi:polyhomeotic-like protein 1
MTTLSQKDKPPTPQSQTNQSQESHSESSSGMKPPVSVSQSTSTSTSTNTTNNMLSLVKKAADAESKLNEAKKAAANEEAKKKADEANAQENATKQMSQSTVTSQANNIVSVSKMANTTSTSTTTSSVNSQTTIPTTVSSQMGTGAASTTINTETQSTNENSASDETPTKGKKSLNSSPATNGNQSINKDLPKAMVKPNILTHVIEGYVIQESSEPFPVNRQRYSEKENDEPPKKKQAIESPDGRPSEGHLSNGNASKAELNVSSTTLSVQTPNDLVACEKCGKQEIRSKLKKKRFCSLPCARAAKNAVAMDTINTEDRAKTPQSSPAPIDKLKTPQHTPVQSANNSKMDVDHNDSTSLPPIEEHIMMKWSVAEVCDFIKNLPGCSDYADDFALQEIDGQALLLLKENHLVSAMGMKLGPALKIVNKIESMRVLNANNSEQQNNQQTSPQTPQ